MYIICLLGFYLNVLKLWFYLIEIYFIKKLVMYKLNLYVIVIIFILNEYYIIYCVIYIYIDFCE